MTEQIADPDSDNYEELVLDHLETIGVQLTTLIDRLDTLHRRDHVRITDFNMPFAALVGIIVKIALASIPALIIVSILLFIAAAIASALLGLTIL